MHKLVTTFVGCFLLVAGVRADDSLLEHHDVFVNGEVVEELSYHTYRIPNIARANDGTLIAVAEARLANAGDPGATHIDLVYKRSADGGKSWSTGKILDRHPETVLDANKRPTDRTSACNSVTFVNHKTGRVWNLDMRLPSGVPSAATKSGVDDMQTWARYSDDSGATWSAPQRIPGATANIPYEDFYPNLGSSMQLSSGRLVVPATQHNSTIDSHSFALYSDDDGGTWKAGALIDVGTNEAQIVELADGPLLMSARQNEGNGRVFAISDDQGKTWKTSYTGFSSTPVMEAVERYTKKGVRGETVNRLLHSVPVGGPGAARSNLEIMIATDELQPGGPRFSAGRRVYDGWAGYSDLVNIDGDEVGILWERGETGHHQRITYTRINRKFLETGQPVSGSIAPIRVACVGDSITYGFGIDDRDRNSYPARLQQLLGNRYQVRNFGASGSGILKNAKRAGSDWPRCYAKHAEFRDSLAFEPNVVVINLGINDVVHWDELGDQFVDDYVDLIRQYQKLPSRPKIFVCCKLAPLFPGQTFFGNSNLEKLNEAIAQVAKRTGVRTIDLHIPLVDHPEWFPDHLHPNVDGARRIAEVVAEALGDPVQLPRR